MDADLQMSERLIEGLVCCAIRNALSVYRDTAFIAWAARWLSKERRELSDVQQIRGATWAESVELACGGSVERMRLHGPYAAWTAASCAAHALAWKASASFSEADAVLACGMQATEHAVEAARGS
jgi:hypothetical protein